MMGYDDSGIVSCMMLPGILGIMPVGAVSVISMHTDRGCHCASTFVMVTSRGQPAQQYNCGCGTIRPYVPVDPLVRVIITNVQHLRQYTSR